MDLSPMQSNKQPRAEQRRHSCLIQVDADGLCVIAKDCSYEDFSLQPDTVFHSGMDNLLELFQHFDVKATFFVVGQDLTDRDKKDKFRFAQALGHEFANHTDTHPRWFKRLSAVKKREEIETCHKRVEDALGVSPRGFRAPGYSISTDTLPILAELGYLYDSSVFPSFYDSLISRLLYKGNSGGKEMGLMSEPFSWDKVRRVNHPYRPSVHDIYRRGKFDLWELPVTCMPFLKFPFHASYVLNTHFGLFHAAELAVRAFRLPLNYLFHLKDASVDLTPEQLQKCFFNPISPKNQSNRLQLLEKILRQLKTHEVCITSEYVSQLSNGNGH